MILYPFMNELDCKGLLLLFITCFEDNVTEQQCLGECLELLQEVFEKYLLHIKRLVFLNSKVVQ